MTVTTNLEIVKYPNEILRQVSKTIENNDKEAIETLLNMKKYVQNEENYAMGLALPQVGVSKRGFVAELQGKVEVVINPKILMKNGTSYDTEGCLSVEEQNDGIVPRSKEIMVIYKDHNMKVKKKVLKGLSARVFQHELDHLDGILYMDRIKEE